MDLCVSLVHELDYNWNTITNSSQKLNSDPPLICHPGSKTQSLRLCKLVCERVQQHVSKQVQTRVNLRNMIRWEI